ncbi:MAG: hypothetical protein DCC49_01420 [Acidobacteria bacterium]|nr:MAG: hypothetical protein DCC49_01420 [Acidobacteriota bacterium]
MTYLLASAATRILVLGAIACGVAGGVVIARALPRRSKPMKEESEPEIADRSSAARSLGLEGEGWILFTSSTCTPCKRVREDLIASASNWIEVDVDREPEMFKLWNVYRVPTLVWMSDSGKTQERHGPASARQAIAAR